MRDFLSGVVRSGVCAVAALAACASAEPWTQEQLLQSYKSLHATEGAVTCAVEQARVVILFDNEGKAAAMVAEADNKGVRRLARQIELGETQEAETTGCIVLLRESDSNAPRKRLLENTPLQALSFLIGQNYYSPTALQPDGRVLWATGKRRSVDIIVPATGTEAIRCAEITSDMELTPFAANVLARKLGYPDDNSADATKASQAAALRAHAVLYYSKAHEATVAAKGKRFFLCEGDRTAFRELTKEKGTLDFPSIFPPTEKAPAPKAGPAAEGTVPPAAATPEEKDLTPKEALKAFIERMKKL